MAHHWRALRMALSGVPLLIVCLACVSGGEDETDAGVELDAAAVPDAPVVDADYWIGPLDEAGETLCDDVADEPALVLCASMERFGRERFSDFMGGYTEGAWVGEAEVGGFAIGTDLREERAGRVEGRVGGAYRGSAHFADHGWDGSTDRTVEAWVRVDFPIEEPASPSGSADFLFRYGSTTDSGFGLYVRGLLAERRGALGGGFEGWFNNHRTFMREAVVPGEWYHVAIVIEPSARRAALIVNGREAFRLPWFVADIVPAESRVIGVRDQAHLHTALEDVSIDEIMVFDAARTEAQVCADGGGTYADGICSYEPAVVTRDDCAGVDADYFRRLRTDDWAGAIELAHVTDMESFVAEYTPTSGELAGDAEGWTVVGQAMQFANVLEPACYAYLRAAEADPANPLAIQNAGSCIVASFDPGARTFESESLLRADRMFRCAAQLAPRRVGPLLGIATVQYHLRDWETAMVALTTAADLAPDHPEPAYQAMRLAEASQMDTMADAFHARALAAASSRPRWRQGVERAGPGGFCCPCGDAPVLHETIGDCTSTCSGTLGCFTGICDQTSEAACLGPRGAACPMPAGYGFSVCLPPRGLQACVQVNDMCELTFSIGFNALVNVSVGATYNPFNGNWVSWQGSASVSGFGTAGSVGFKASDAGVQVTWDAKLSVGPHAYTVAQSSPTPF